MSEVNGLTWILLATLIVGKTAGIVGCSWVATKIGFPLPAGMNMKHLFVTGLVAALGLTVALFVSTQAFTSPELQGAAKMGAVFSAGVALLSWVVAEVLGVRPGESLITKISRLRGGSPAYKPEDAPQPTAAFSGQADT